MAAPSIGRIVVAVGAAARYNGADVAPAIITRVWSDECVNVTVFRDAGAPYTATSVRLFADEAEARGSLQHKTASAAFWPARN
jgi:hypothetical protein